MLEPRRLAAKAAAQRLAAELGESVGERVGYSVRLESCTSAATRLEVLTDGLFLRRLQADPGLAGVDCLIFDEFHERGADTDLALALVRQQQGDQKAAQQALVQARSRLGGQGAERLDQVAVSWGLADLRGPSGAPARSSGLGPARH